MSYQSLCERDQLLRPETAIKNISWKLSLIWKPWCKFIHMKTQDIAKVSILERLDCILTVRGNSKIILSTGFKTKTEKITKTRTTTRWTQLLNQNYVGKVSWGQGHVVRFRWGRLPITTHAFVLIGTFISWETFIKQQLPQLLHIKLQKVLKR